MSDLKITIDSSDIPKAVRQMDVLDRSTKRLVEAYRNQQITQSNYMAGMNQLVAKYKALGISTEQAKQKVWSFAKTLKNTTAITQSAAVAQNNFANATQRSTRRMGQGQVMIQQTGYQIGDFLVQVQSGTNWMVAFGQQATQVAGTLTLLGGKMVLLGTVLGIAIPLATALGAAFMRTRQDADDASTAIERLSRSLESLDQVSLDNVRNDLIAISSEANRFLEILSEIRLQRVRDSLEQSLSGILETGVLGDVGRAIEQGFEVGGSGSGGLTQQLIDDFNEVQGILESISGQSAPELARSISSAVVALESQGLLTDELREQFDQLVTDLGLENELLREGVNLIEMQSAASEALASIWQTLVNTAREAGEAFKLDQIEDAQALADKIAEAAEEMLEAQESARELKEQVSEAKRQAELLAAVDIKSGITEAANEAARLARNLAQAAMARNYQGRELAANGNQPLPPGAVQLGDGTILYAPPEEPSGGGVSRSQTQTLQEIIQARQDQIRVERELLALNEEARRAREIAIDLENTYQGELSETERSALNAAAQQLAAEERLNQAIQDRIDMQERLADTISQSFGDAFMSMVDGTKTAEDAFKDMARQIISELFRILVVEQMVQSIRGSILGVFGGGSGLGIAGKLASGGSMMAGKPYLVGERGPEIVIPGRSGTVMNNNLSSTQSGGQNVQVEVFVNDNGNFDARVRQVSQSVVAKAAPQIVRGAERQILDQRRRGGVYKTTFG